MNRTRILLLGLALALLGCASTGDPDRPRRDSNRITGEEIAASSQTDALRLVQSLRPRWVAVRGQMSITDPTAGQVVVYLDGARLGGSDALRGISTMDVAMMEYLDASTASSRFGLGHTGGAILVTTRLR